MYLRMGQDAAPLLHELFQCSLIAQVDLIDDQQHRTLHARNTSEEIGILIGLFHHVGHVDQHIGITECRLRELSHFLLELVIGTKHPGRIRIDDLHLGRIDDTHDPVPGGLRLGGDDGDALAYEQIHQRTLAYIGVPDDIDKSGTMGCAFCLLIHALYGVRIRGCCHCGEAAPCPRFC